MIEYEGFDEVVLLFQDDLSAVEVQLHYSDFELLLTRQRSLGQFAASVVKGVYVQVGDNLSAGAQVYFLLKVNEDGRVDDQFNVPLRYLADQAGLGPDLGNGTRVRMACRGHCPVPWHATNLWQPEGVGDLHPVKRVQKVVWRNKLNLRTRKTIAAVDVNAPDLQRLQASLEERLESTLSPEGAVDVSSLIRQHSEQVQQIAQRFKVELAQKEQGFADKLRRQQEQVEKLRAALKREKGRNRRLQEMLRGEAQPKPPAV